MKFLRNLLATIIGFFISLAFLIFLFVAIVASLSKKEPVIVEPNSVLQLDLTHKIEDYSPKDRSLFSQAFEDLTDEQNKKLGLNNIINAIENAKTDKNILGISIRTSSVNAGISQIQEIRDKLKEFKKTGKFVYAYSDVYSQKNYYLSSVADSVFVNPVGEVDFKGLDTEVLYFKDFQDKYGVKMEIVRHGKYKSAVEPYIADKMSDANREQITSFLNSIWSEILDGIGKSRNISSEKLNQIADNSGGRNSEEALKNRLVDGVIYQDEYFSKIESITDKDFESISLIDYIDSGKGYVYKTSQDKIAVVYAQGDILYGQGSQEVIGQQMMSDALERVRKDDDIKAVVLRVNSPGGSALASELIWRELLLTKKEKPLVVSMGNLAASGGYYISCVADKIVAEPTTITGSIGVFGALPNVHRLAGELGINAQRVSTNKSASYSPFEPISKEFYQVTKQSIERVYNTFVSRVSQGRKMTFEQIDKIAQGRVWTGKQAVELGLVDSLGGLQEAIKTAAKLADLDNYKVRNFPKYDKKFSDIFTNLPFAKANRENFLKQTLGDKNYQIYKSIDQLKSLKGVQSRMPFVFDIR